LKKIVGFVVATFLFGSSIGYAANTSLLGAKVTGLFSVQQNGTKIADAVIINGSAYVPVRALSEATGTGLTVEGKTIIMESNAKVTVGDSKVEMITKRVLTEDEKETLRSKLDVGESALIKYREVIAQTETEIEANSESSNITELKNFIVDLQARITTTEMIIADIKAQLGE
jgi:hypothetical protein